MVGSLNLDLVSRVEHLPVAGETVLGSDLERHAGGKGANQAVAAARLGADVAMVGAVGRDDAGSLLLASLRADGVDAGAVAHLSHTATGAALIAVDGGGENQIVVAAGANSHVDEAAVSSSEATIAAAVVVVLQLEIPLDGVAAAVAAATGIVVLTPAPARPLPAELLARIDVLVPNRGELAALTGRHVDDHEAAIAAARALRGDASHPGPAAVVVTLGADGALVVDEHGADHVPARQVEVVDTTAAGDAFSGALADGLARGLDLRVAVRRSVVAASLAVGRSGAQPSLPTADELAALGA